VSKKKTKKNIQAKSQPKTSTASSVEAKSRAKRKSLLPGSWKVNLGIFLLLIIATVILYSPDLHLGFFEVDDTDYVTKNPWIKSITSENISHILGNPYFANYSPVHLFSYMFDYSLAGQNAYAFHLSSNIWAGIVAGFVFLTALAFTQNRIISIAAAILFVVHPVHVEAVAWISSRKDLVATAFALPSLLAYLKWRNDKNKTWYIISVLLFLIAVAGKLSVATFPAVFLAYDYFVAKRPLVRSIIDKIPFVVVAVIVAMAAASAQPSMGHRPDPYVLSAALAQNFWLLSGFASYVLYRMPPETTKIALEVGGIIFLIAVFIAPFFFRKKFPVAAVLAYWILFAFIPAQVLSFTHPVTDRYIFFPSVAGVIAIAWLLFLLVKKIGKYQLAVFSVIIILIAVLWARNTLNYLAEWKDPRSVWYAAMDKSADPTIPQNLGSYYVGIAQRMEPSQQTEESKEKLQLLASSVWANDQRLPKLFSELSAGQQNGPVQKEFKDKIFSLAWEAFEKTVKTKRDRVMPALYYNRGIILLEQNNLAGAKKEFTVGINESAGESFAGARNEVMVYCYYNLGRIALKENNYPEALKWFQLAKNLQDQAGVNWMPTLAKTIKQLEDAIAAQQTH
jgi:hypothetical protein